MNFPDNHQRGAVALLTAIIISLLLSIIITGTVTVMISELRQSNDSEQSIRAYNAAEAGVEDAILKIKNNPHVDQTCGPLNGSKNLSIDPSSPGVVGWSCQQISFSGQPSGTLADPDKSQQFDLAGAPGIQSATVEWDTAGGHDITAPPALLPDVAQWLSQNRPAAIELTLVSYPKGGGPISPAQLDIKNYLILPSHTGSGRRSIASPFSNPFYAKCLPSGTYRCKMTLQGFLTNRDYVVRIRTRYTGTDFLLSFYSSLMPNPPSLVTVPDGTATIDVTGKAGNVYRRVIYKVPFTKGVATGLDYVLYSDTDICKDLTLINGAATNNCP